MRFAPTNVAQFGQSAGMIHLMSLVQFQPLNKTCRIALKTKYYRSETNNNLVLKPAKAGRGHQYSYSQTYKYLNNIMCKQVQGGKK